MRFRFNNKKLEALYYTEKDAHKYPPEAVRALSRVVQIIEAAVNEQELRTFASLHYKHLKGDRDDQYSIRLNLQWRLILTRETDEYGTCLVIEDLVDYH